MLFRKSLLKNYVFLVLLLPVCFSLIGCAGVDRDCDNNVLEDPGLKYEDGEDYQVMEQKNKNIESEMPLLDQKVPDNLETATLALG